ncbi:Fc.00g095170.m01.CDS01 [Cosmosporella sp. VM-42]
MEADLVDSWSVLGIKDVLNADSRPTFLIDLDPDEDSPVGSHAIRPVFCNTALNLHERLLNAVCGNDISETPETPDNGGEPAPSYDDFKDWATGVTTQDDSRDIFPLSFLYMDLLWTGSTVQRRWRLISGNRSWRADIPSRPLSASALHEVTTADPREEQPSTPLGQGEGFGNLDELPNPVQGLVGETTLPATTAAVLPREQPPTKVPFHKETPKGSSDEVTRSSTTSGSIILSRPEKAVTDWTVPEPKGVLSPHLQFARSIDWATTPLGPMGKWSPELRQVANLCMNNPHPACLFWGSELTMLYNLAYATEAGGNKHPSMMGTGLSGPWSEIWEAMEAVFSDVARTGVSFRQDNEFFPINRRGFIEETYFSWSVTPLYGGTDRILGFYNAPFETTDQVLNQRRMRTINQLADCITQATTVKGFWTAVLEGLEDNHFDVPFALLYSVGDAEDGDHSSTSSGSTISQKCCHLEGKMGVPDGHVAAPAHLDLKRSRDGFVPAFREAMRTREPTLLRTRDGTLPRVLLEGINWRGFEEPCREAIIFPVRPTNGDAVLAFLVLGVNPRRMYDEGYQSFTKMLNRQLATSLASIILFEDETRRSRDAAEAAALEKEELTQQLNLQASRLRRMTELSPLGMFLISPEGVLREANDRFYEMTRHSRETQTEMSWRDVFMESSLDTLDEGWRRLVDEHLPWSGELQLKQRYASPVNAHDETIDYWVMFSAHSEFGSRGILRSIMGSITDISHLKWAQGLQDRQLQEAEETRRQQNEFIDITSHEMRNPLSAILQCADDISTALGAHRTDSPSTPQDVVESCIDAAQTIALCVQHQKSIVDDILTISKLDSNLLLITPVACQPASILRRILKMFDPEVQAKGIKLTLEVQPSYRELAVEWVAIDPSRVFQILINLMTNAIKFMASSEKREITVAVGASLDAPDGSDTPGFQFVPATAGMSNITSSEDWGPGEALYVRFRVKDTGCGLTEGERQLLFQRFKQASPRTHAQYGGSGLGLFISKRLAELHGGQIGVASIAGEGSQFGFFIEARRTDSPSETNSPRSHHIQAPLGVDVPLAQVTQLVAPPPPDLVTPIKVVEPTATKANIKLEPFEPRGFSILVVEDNLINQKVLVNQLRKAGCNVSATNDGIEALAFLKKTHFCRKGGQELSVILMDLEMPNMDGLTCVREIRKMEGEGSITKHVPVIAVTANVRAEQVQKAMQSGMDDMVSKPFRIPDMLKKIETLLKGFEEHSPPVQEAVK